MGSSSIFYTFAGIVSADNNNKNINNAEIIITW